jgi:hypothetical protein
MWADCVRTLESLSVLCILLEIFRQILNKMRGGNNNVNFT